MTDVPLTPVPGSRRGKPGRPKKGDFGIYAKPQLGHNSGTPTAEQRSQSGEQDRASVTLTVVPIAPRLLDLTSAASYLGISEFTVRELEQQGILTRVRIPLLGRGELRKLLFDREALDRLIETWKDRC